QVDRLANKSSLAVLPSLISLLRHVVFRRRHHRRGRGRRRIRQRRKRLGSARRFRVRLGGGAHGQRKTVKRQAGGEREGASSDGYILEILRHHSLLGGIRLNS